MRNTLTLAALAAGLVALGTARPAAGQTMRADLIMGRVIDSAGVAVPGAIVQATEVGSGLTQTVRTTSDGAYGIRFAEGGGVYQVLVRSPGMVPGRFVLRSDAQDRVLTGNVQLIPVVLRAPIASAVPRPSPSGAAA